MSSGVRAFVKVKVGAVSTIGVRGDFPYKHGNYFSNIEGYYFVNLWYDNLMHLLDNGYIDDEVIEVLLFKSEDSDKFKYAYVVDKRVPTEALHAPYFCGIMPSSEIIRMHHNVPDDKCLCEVDDYSLTESNGCDNKGMAYLLCSQCGTHYKVQRQRTKGVYRVKLAEGEHWGTWILAWQEDGKFKRIPSMTDIDESLIIKIDVDRVHNFGTGEQQNNSIPLGEFRFTGLIKAKPKK